MGPEHLDAAAGLLAARQRRLRLVRPELPAAFEQADAHRPALEALLERAGAYGAVAHRGAETIGFLAGYPRAEPIWGRACWSPIEGSALAEGADPELIRDLYAVWAEHFAHRGYFRQYLMRALLAGGFAEAREARASHCIADWRTASLPTDRSWTALGFRPTHYRLHRHADERISWAAGRRA